MKTEITRLLGELSKAADPPKVQSQTQAATELFAVVYGELRRLAAAQLRHLRPGQTLTPTALVHEAYIRLVGDADPGWSGRGHFFCAAAQAMRQIIVDQIRRKLAGKRGGGRPNDELKAAAVISNADVDPAEALAIDAALAQLTDEYPRQAKVVVLRYFGGLAEQEIAQVLDVSLRTVERDWRFARAYLRALLSKGQA